MFSSCFEKMFAVVSLLLKESKNVSILAFSIDVDNIHEVHFVFALALKMSLALGVERLKTRTFYNSPNETDGNQHTLNSTGFVKMLLNCPKLLIFHSLVIHTATIVQFFS